jgi:glycosyltransferase involved in cell wall biosynthesis
MPKADLVLVSYNSKQDLERFLPTIKKHTKDYSLVIVDNGSNEETKKYLETCGENVIFQNNLGYGTGCNRGAKQGQSEFVVFLNCDLEATSNWLENLLAPFEDPDVAITGARLFKPDGMEYPTPKEKNAIGCCYAVRRRVFEELGGFDENFFLFFEETDLSLRTVKSGYKVVRSEAKMIHIHPHFFPLSPSMQPIWDKSEKYFREKHRKNKNSPSVALVMCVKNEEKGLERAIKSCRYFADEIVIAVDNSSTDKTEEIAKKYATTLKHFDWCDDFSKIRNFAHEGVKSDWCFFLDGHEYVSECRNLEEYLSQDCDGLMCQIEMESGMRFGNPRFYKNGVQFSGRVHEKQACQNIKEFPLILIKHDRLHGQSLSASREREIQRKDQVLRIMSEEYRQNKKNCRASFHLALHFHARGQFMKSNRWWKRYLKYSNVPAERWYAFFSMSLNHYFQGHLFRAFWYANLADQETPGRWEISKLKGLIYFARQFFAEAAHYIVESFHENHGPVDYKPWPRDLSGSYNLIGECLFNLGVYDRAYLAFTRAADVCENDTLKDILKKRAALMFEIAKANPKIQKERG